MPSRNGVLADLDQSHRASYAGQPSKYVYIGWFVGLLALTYLLGFTLASAIFVVAFITAECGRPMLRNVAFGLGTVAVLSILSYFLYLQYPDGMLADYVALPS